MSDARTFSKFYDFTTYGHRWVKKVTTRKRVMREPRVLILLQKQLVMVSAKGEVKRRVRLHEIQTINMTSSGVAFLPSKRSEDAPMNVQWHEARRSEPPVDAFLHNVVSLSRLANGNPTVVYLKPQDNMLTMSPPNTNPIPVGLAAPPPVPLPGAPTRSPSQVTFPSQPHAPAGTPASMAPHSPAMSPLPHTAALQKVVVNRTPGQTLGVEFSKDLDILKVFPGTAAEAAGLGAYVNYKVREINNIPMNSIDQLRVHVPSMTTMVFGMISPSEAQHAQKDTRPNHAPAPGSPAAGAPKGTERVPIGISPVEAPPAPSSQVVVKRQPTEPLGVEFNNALQLIAVTPGSPAERAGLHQHMYQKVLKVNGVDVNSLQHLAELSYMMPKLAYVMGRDGGAQHAQAKPLEPQPTAQAKQEQADDRESAEPNRASVGEAQGSCERGSEAVPKSVEPNRASVGDAQRGCAAVPKKGDTKRVETVNVARHSGANLGIEFNNDLEIVHVVPNSPASKAGLEAHLHNKVTSVNGQPVTDLNSLKKVSLYNVNPVPFGIEVEDPQGGKSEAASAVPQDTRRMTGATTCTRDTMLDRSSYTSKKSADTVTKPEATQTGGSLAGEPPALDQAALVELRHEVAYLKKQYCQLQTQLSPERKSPMRSQVFVPTSWSQSVGLGRMLAFSYCDDELL
eukprot:TRINITY_DN4559_c0_g1_i1.p1 TRINITY_DN4559_c0_g1~~TRINITY_DN4559_c0_g1_i1.p1  ORF type:complete len:680 (+),score=109.88 TRINITY_DN4559_c0_g1_i1:532-2571(+)